MSEPAHRAVFLSYASQDAEAAGRIAGALRGAGVEVWFDQSELVGGDAWDAKIRRQIGSCALFVPIISAATQARLEGYFRLEWKLAANRTLTMADEKAFLLPVVIDGTHDTTARVPAEFKAVQWTRLPEGEAPPSFCERVKSLLGGRELEAARTGPATTQRPLHHAIGTAPAFSTDSEGVATPETPRAKRRLLLIPTLVGVAAVVAFAVWRPWQRPGETAAHPPSATSPGAASFMAGQRGAGTGASAANPAGATRTMDSASAKSIAVLPFVNLSADKADEYLCDGMTEELLNVLARVKGLRVPGRSSSFAFKGRTEEGIFRKMGEQLRVNSVLEGSVRKIGDKLRITAQLINVADGYQLWSETYDGEIKDILTVQGDVAKRVVQALQVQLGVEDTRALAKKSTENPEAHRLYLLGRHHFTKFTDAGLAEAMRCFNEAIRLDPSFALAYCGLADNYGWMGGNVMQGKEAWAREKELALKALELDPNLADAHLSLALALGGHFDWPGTDREFKRAIELNPNLALARDQYAWLLILFGRFDEAIAESRKAVALDPLSPLLNVDLGWNLYNARRFDEAIAQGRHTLELVPNHADSHVLVGFGLLRKGNLAAALQQFETAKTLDTMPRLLANLGYAHAMMGDRVKAQDVLRELDGLAKQRYVPPGTRVGILIALGDKAGALDWLDRCYEEHDMPCWFLKVDPMYDPLRAEPHFQALLRKIGLER